MEKYRELVLTLIKNHRKFIDCENIIDDIYDEVCQKASSIVENIEDENIIRNYLIKTVSSAMITVPKRLGIKTRTERPAISFVQEQKEEPSAEILIQEEEPLQMDEPEEQEPLETVASDENDDLLEEIAEEASDESVLNTNDTYDKTLVDKMINNADPSASDTEISELDLDDTDNLVIENEPELSSDDEEKLIISDEDSSEKIQEFDSQEEPLDAESDNFDLDDAPETEKEDEETLFDEPVNDLFGGKNIDAVTLEDAFPETAQEIMSIEEAPDELLVEDTELSAGLEEDIDISESEPVSIETDEDTAVETLDEESANETAQKEIYEAPDFIIPDLSCFKAETIERDIDETAFVEKLNNTEKTFPEMRIKEVLRLKYYENKSIAEIAEVLNISKENVINALNEAADIVED